MHLQTFVCAKALRATKCKLKPPGARLTFPPWKVIYLFFLILFLWVQLFFLRCSRCAAVHSVTCRCTVPRRAELPRPSASWHTSMIRSWPGETRHRAGRLFHRWDCCSGNLLSHTLRLRGSSRVMPWQAHKALTHKLTHTLGRFTVNVSAQPRPQDCG